MEPQSRRSNSHPIRAGSYTNTTPLTPRPTIAQAPAGVKAGSTIRVATLTIVVIGIIMFGGLSFWHGSDKPVLPSNVSRQLSFGVYFPTTKINNVSIDKRTISYQANEGRLGYRAQLSDGTTIDVNQQATPESFVDVPQAYDKLVSSLQPYSSFESVNGRVSLTHPKELQGSQSAVMNAKGTLLFARPSKSLSNEQWRQLFNGLFAEQITAAK